MSVQLVLASGQKERNQHYESNDTVQQIDRATNAHQNELTGTIFPPLLDKQYVDEYDLALRQTATEAVQAFSWDGIALLPEMESQMFPPATFAFPSVQGYYSFDGFLSNAINESTSHATISDEATLAEWDHLSLGPTALAHVPLANAYPGHESLIMNQGPGGQNFWPNLSAEAFLNGNAQTLEQNHAACLESAELTHGLLTRGISDQVWLLEPQSHNTSVSATDTSEVLPALTLNPGLLYTTLDPNQPGHSSTSFSVQPAYKHAHETEEPKAGLIRPIDQAPAAGINHKKEAGSKATITAKAPAQRKSQQCGIRKKASSTKADTALTAFTCTTVGSDQRLSTFATARPRRAFKNERRQEVGAVRRSGACFRCKLWRKSCDTDHPCQNCFQKATSAGSDASMICFRPNVSDCGFFREASTVHSQPVSQNMVWITSSVVTLQFHVVPPSWNSRPLQIRCRHFQPRAHEIVIKHVGGRDVNRAITIPAYAAIDLGEVKEQLVINLRHYCEVFFKESIQPKSTSIVTKTIAMALHFSLENEKTLVTQALQVWVGSKLCSTERSLTGLELLGMTSIDDPESHLFGHVPIPPVLDHQCDSMAIEYMKELTASLLSAISRKIQAGRRCRKDWFEVFLTTFILLNNLEYVYGIQKTFQKYLGSTDEFGSHVKKTSEKYIDKWIWSAENILFMYNAFFKNTGAPFSLDTVDSAIAEGNLDKSGQDYVAEVMRVLPNIKASARKVSDVTDCNYEMVWCQELFIPG